MGSLQCSKISLVLLLVLGSASHLSAFYNDLRTFRTFIVPRCYNSTNGAPLVNGQEYPLSQTLENFINLVEQFEIANPDMKLNDVLFIFLRNFTHESLVYRKSFIVNTPTNADYYMVDDLWDSRLEKEDSIPSYVNPYDDDDICSLYFMLSHTVNDTAAWEDEDTSIFPENGEGAVARAEVIKTKHPREQGTVFIRSSGDSVALSRVIMGLYLGLTTQESSLSDILGKKKRNDYNGEMYDISPVFLLTLADAILLSKWPDFIDVRAKEMGKNGAFLNIQNKGTIIDNRGNVNYLHKICPTISKLPENATSLYTYALVRGATDGLILGSIAQENNGVINDEVYLSQILKTYYSPQGIPAVQQSNGVVPTFNYSTCYRSEIVEAISGVLQDQVQSLLAILSTDYINDMHLKDEAWEFFQQKKSEIFMEHESDFCHRRVTTETLKCETPVDVIVILDTTNGIEDIKRQQEIIGFMANNMELSLGGSTFSIFLDQLNGTSAFDLVEVIEKSDSSASIACHTLYLNLQPSTLEKETVIEGISSILADWKNQEKDDNGANAKVVIYFNFKEEETVSQRLNKALGNLLRTYTDVTFIAAGRNEKVLKKYVGLSLFGISRLISDADTQKLGQELAQKVCLGPASLQYSNCKSGLNEGESVYEGTVTQDAVQYWAMDSKYFEKSFTPKITFSVDPNGGNIKVCHNRATTKPELEEKNCLTTDSSAREVFFKNPNPCKGLTRHSCSSMMFSVIGKDIEKNNQLNFCKDPECKSFNQVKFKVSHEGIRCSGCSAVASATSLLIASLIFAFFFCNKNY